MASEKKVGRYIVRCEKAPATETITLFADLNNTFGGDSGVLAAIRADVGREGEIRAFMLAFIRNQIDGEAVRDFVDRCVSMCRVDGEPGVLGAKPESLEDGIEIAFFCLKTQFRDFLAVSLPDAPAGEMDQTETTKAA